MKNGTGQQEETPKHRRTIEKKVGLPCSPNHQEWVQFSKGRIGSVLANWISDPIAIVIDQQLLHQYQTWTRGRETLYRRDR